MAPTPLQQACGPPQPLFRVLYGPRALVYLIALVRRPKPAIVLLDESLEPTHTFHASRITSVERTNGQNGCSLDIHLETCSVKLGLESQEVCDALCKAITTTLGCPLYSYGNLTAAFKRAIAGGVVGGRGGGAAVQASLDEIMGTKTSPPTDDGGVVEGLEGIDGSMGRLTSSFKRMEVALGASACNNVEPNAVATSQFSLIIDGQPCQGSSLTFKVARRASHMDFLLYKVEWRISSEIASRSTWNDTVAGRLDSLYLTEEMIGHYVKLDVYLAVKQLNRREYFKCTATAGPVSMSTALCLEILANSVLDSPLLQVFIPVKDLNLVFPLARGGKPVVAEDGGKGGEDGEDDEGDVVVVVVDGGGGGFQGSARRCQESSGTASDEDVKVDTPVDEDVTVEEEDVPTDQGYALNPLSGGGEPVATAETDTPLQGSARNFKDGGAALNLFDASNHLDTLQVEEDTPLPSQPTALATAVIEDASDETHPSQEQTETQPDATQQVASPQQAQKMVKIPPGLKPKLRLTKIKNAKAAGAKIGRLMVKMFKGVDKVKKAPKPVVKPAKKAPASVVSHAFGKRVTIAMAPLTLKICVKGLRLWSGSMHRDVKWQSLDILPRNVNPQDDDDDAAKKQDTITNAIEMLITDPDEVKRNRITIYATSSFDATLLWHALIFNKYKKMTIEECEKDLASGTTTNIKRVHVKILKRHAQQTDMG